MKVWLLKHNRRFYEIDGEEIEDIPYYDKRINYDGDNFLRLQ